MLTFKQMCELADSVPDHPEPTPLILPSWFPEEHREMAEKWARDHGWDGVAVVEKPVPPPY